MNDNNTDDPLASAVYRLYTVVPRLLDLIDELTNWYIRINRRRLKGESGPDDTIHALNSLFETLLTLCRTLTPFTPFFTENIYQGLRPFFPDDHSNLDMGEDLRSVHFLPFPHTKQEYFDPVVERQVERMQAVIVLGRSLRDRHNLAIKVRRIVILYPCDAASLKTDVHLSIDGLVPPPADPAQ